MDRGRFYKLEVRTLVTVTKESTKSEEITNEYIRDYGVYSFVYFIERLCVSFILDKYERFALAYNDGNKVPTGVFVGAGIDNDDVERALAEDYGMDIKLVD